MLILLLRAIQVLSIFLFCFFLFGMLIVDWMSAGWSGRPASVFLRETFLGGGGLLLGCTVVTAILSTWLHRRLKKQSENPRS